MNQSFYIFFYVLSKILHQKFARIVFLCILFYILNHLIVHYDVQNIFNLGASFLYSIFFQERFQILH